MSTFNPCDPATWEMTLTTEQVSAIYQRPVGGIKKAVQTGKFVPAPFMKQPYRWRRIDVERHVQGARGFGLKAVV